VLGTWTVRFTNADIAEHTSSSCVLDPTYPGLGCLTDTVSYATGSGLLVLSSVVDSSAADLSSGFSIGATVATNDTLLSNSAPRPRCSGKPAPCWALNALGASSTFLEGPTIARSGDSFVLSFVSPVLWATPSTPSRVMVGPPQGIIRLPPPYRRGYDSTKYGVLELVKQ
jgi:hypothetical protein